MTSLEKAKGQQGQVEHHAQLFELTLENVLAVVHPQRECEWNDCLDALQKAKNNLFVRFWCLSDAAGLRSQSRDPRRPPGATEPPDKRREFGRS